MSILSAENEKQDFILRKQQKKKKSVEIRIQIFLASILCAKIPSLLRVFAWLFRRNKSGFIYEVL